VNLACRQPTSEDVQGFAKVVRRRRNDVEQQNPALRERVDHDVGSIEKQRGRNDAIGPFTERGRMGPSESGGAGCRYQQPPEQRCVLKLLAWHPDKVGGQMRVFRSQSVPKL